MNTILHKRIKTTVEGRVKIIGEDPGIDCALPLQEKIFYGGKRFVSNSLSIFWGELMNESGLQSFLSCFASRSDGSLKSGSLIA